ncbi:unnamed protein product [Brassica oleracea var. botrytis]|uniref:Uncharacterized protein n=1 Tax=Brassica oleracea TaxID=3712 RepID=A0A3P6GKJ4_BRAOL|nr:unnamed protein product [Brassica oleracea]
MEEGVKDNAASPPKPRLTNQSRDVLSMRLLQILLLFLLLSLGISVVGIHMIKFLNHVSSTTLISMYDHGTVTLEIIIRPPLNVWHTKNERPDGRGRYRNGMEPEITLNHWRKGSQWFEINRKLALEIVQDITYYPKFEEFCKPPCYVHEHYFFTMLSIENRILLANKTLKWTD